MRHYFNTKGESQNYIALKKLHEALLSDEIIIALQKKKVEVYNSIPKRVVIKNGKAVLQGINDNHPLLKKINNEIEFRIEQIKDKFNVSK